MDAYLASIKLDINAANLYEYVKAKQGDSGTRKIKIRLMEDGEDINASSSDTAYFRYSKPDGTGGNCPATINPDGTIDVELPDQSLACAGLVSADVYLKDSSGKILSPAVFYIDVVKSPSGKNITSANEYMTLIDAQVLSEATRQEFIAKIAQLDNLVANAGNTSQNSELLDIRVKADGTTATTAGAAVREQIQSLTDRQNVVEADFDIVKEMLGGVSGENLNELIDIRNGDDGVTYQTAGKSVRKQFSDIKLKIEEIVDEIKDARLGADGITRDTLGNSIRMQVTEMVDNMTNAFKNRITNAQTSADNAAANADNAQYRINQLVDTVNIMNTTLQKKGDALAVTDEGMLNLLSDGRVISGPHGPFAGGGSGGGGGGSSTKHSDVTVRNKTGKNLIKIAAGLPCPFEITWSSIEDDLPTGNGTLKVYINGAARITKNVPQGDVSFDLAPYLRNGDNVIRVQVNDIYDSYDFIQLTVEMIELSISSTFDSSVEYKEAITFPYTPIGSVAKTVHFELDGTELEPVTTTVSNRQLTYLIPQQSHGAHSLKVWFESDVGGETISSNVLYYEFKAIVAGNTTPIITSDYDPKEVPKYTSIPLTFSVYDPTSLFAQIEIRANGTVVSTQTVDRSKQTYPYRADVSGDLLLEVVCKDIVKQWIIPVAESDIDVDTETDSLEFLLTSYGRSNNEENPLSWSYEGQDVTFSNFNLVNDGWQLDDENNTVLRLLGADRITIPFKPFDKDFRTTGKTIEIEFSTHHVLDDSALLFTCMQGGKGIEIYPNKAIFKSAQTTLTTTFNKDVRVHLAITVEKRSAYRRIRFYLNGYGSGTVLYPDNDDFQQISPVVITVGNNNAGIDLYSFRVYKNDLSDIQVMNNYIAERQNVDEMLALHAQNDIFDEYGEIVIDKLPKNVPYAVITGASLPQFKGDKKTVEIRFVNQLSPAFSFTATGVQIDVQGTSSATYYRKNYKLKFKSGFDLGTGEHVAKYALREGSMPVDMFCWKADVASSEGANNVELVRLYDDFCPYKTPAQIENSAVRQGIDGFPMIVFWDNGEKTKFLGKYNFNNDKGTPEVFGFTEGDESWEIKNNTSNRVLWKSADYSDEGWKDDFEARYPEDYEDISQLKEFAEWIVTTDTTGCTEEERALRLAKFKAELGNYVEVDSALYYYIITELFLMVDSRAKNMFPSFIGTEIEEGM